MGKVKNILLTPAADGFTNIESGVVHYNKGVEIPMSSNKKIDITLLPSKSLEQMALAMADGSEKYGSYNFDTHSQRDHIAGCYRHLSRYLEGEDVTDDTNLSHLAHAAARLTIALDQALRGVKDDRRDKETK